MSNSKQICIKKRTITVICFFFFFFVLFVLFSLYISSKTISTSSKASEKNPVSTRKTSIPIIGGETVQEGEFPYATYIQNNRDDTYCSGILIYPEWVLTAAHCIDPPTKPNEIILSVGEIHPPWFFGNVFPTRNHPVSGIFIPKGYVDSPYKIIDDIALLKLKDKIEGITSPILADNEKIYTADRLVIALGYGCIGISPTPGTTINPIAPNYLKICPETLYKLSIPILYSKAELKHPDTGEVLTNNTFFLGYPFDNEENLIKTTSSGDSGGPVIIYQGNQPILIGIHSASILRDKPAPSVQIRIIDYLDWINEVINPTIQ